MATVNRRSNKRRRMHNSLQMELRLRPDAARIPQTRPTGSIQASIAGTLATKKPLGSAAFF
jgi:hypothetical protein